MRTLLALALCCASANAASISLTPPAVPADYVLVKFDAPEVWLVGENDGTPMTGWEEMFTPDPVLHPAEFANWPGPQFWVRKDDPEALLRPFDQLILFADHHWGPEVLFPLDEFVLIPQPTPHEFRVEEGAYVREYNAIEVPEPGEWASLWCVGLWLVTGSRLRR